MKTDPVCKTKSVLQNRACARVSSMKTKPTCKTQSVLQHPAAGRAPFHSQSKKLLHHTAQSAAPDRIEQIIAF